MIGMLLGNRYEIIEKIGGGGMAVVYKAKCNLLNRYVAVKILRTEFTNDRDFINKFKGESRAAASLSHPNIVNIYDVGESEDIYYIVMEYVKGKTLKELIKEEGPMTVNSIIDYTKQIAYALQHAHHNHIIHRDIKPHNILVTGDNRAKVTDFGIAVAATSSTITNAGSVIGSVHYFSPEQARGGYTDEKSDLYSLGIVMYEMATGRVPFEGESPITVALKHIQEKPATPSTINPSVSKALEDIILKLMQKEQSSRYQNAASLIEDLNKLKNNTLSANYIRPISEEDSPTQVIPTVRDVDLEGITPRAAAKTTKDSKDTATAPKTKKGNKTVIVAAVALALVAALLFTYGIFYAGSWLKVNEIEVPDLVGKSIDTAEAEVATLGLKLKTTSKYNSEVKKDVIISQKQDPGMKVKKNFPVEVVVSLGSRPVEVPDLVYKNVADAELLLKNAGLRVGDNILEEFSDYPIGVVISQDPQAGTEAPEGSKVNYTISKGKELIRFPMPSVIGQDITNAEEILVQAKLVVGEVTEEASETIPKNIVMEQSIPVGTEVEENTVIDLVISKGPEAEDEVEEPATDETTNTSTKPAPTSTRVITIDLKEFQNTIVDVKIYQIINNQPIEIFAKKHNTTTEDNILRFSVKDSGRQVFEIHINGKLDERIEIDF